MSNPNNRAYHNDDITVFWKPDACIHATICFMKLRKVFDPSKRPWVNMQNGTTEEIISICDQCPTDALTWKWNAELTEKDMEAMEGKKGKEKFQTPPRATKLTSNTDGPAIMKGRFKLADGMVNPIKSSNQIALCRCGGSKNMPFCDGSHLVNGFKG